MMSAPSQPVRTEVPRPSPKPGKKNKDKDKKKKLDKTAIGAPVANTFIHVSGVATDGSGFRMVDNSHLIADPVIASMLKKAGIPFEEIGKTEEEREKNIEMIKRQTMSSGLYDKYEQKERRRTMRMTTVDTTFL